MTVQKIVCITYSNNYIVAPFLRSTICCCLTLALLLKKNKKMLSTFELPFFFSSSFFVRNLLNYPFCPLFSPPFRIFNGRAQNLLYWSAVHSVFVLFLVKAYPDISTKVTSAWTLYICLFSYICFLFFFHFFFLKKKERQDLRPCPRIRRPSMLY